MLEKRDADESRGEYRQLCAEVPNPAERLSLCLRGHDVQPSLAQPLADFLAAVALLD